MRGITSALLLCVFGALLPSATVISLAAPAELLPICCRANGAHHCIMQAMMEGKRGVESVPMLRAANCPYSNLHFFTTGPVTTGEQPRSGAVALVAVLFHPVLQAEVLVTFHFDRANPRAPPLPFRFQA